MQMMYAGGEVTGSWLCNIGVVDWKDLADSGKKNSRVRVQMWACWAGWEIGMFWNGAMYQKRCLWIGLDITRFCEQQRQPSSGSAWPACPKNGKSGGEVRHNLHSRLSPL